jgi:hypothetical protein
MLALWVTLTACGSDATGPDPLPEHEVTITGTVYVNDEPAADVAVSAHEPPFCLSFGPCSGGRRFLATTRADNVGIYRLTFMCALSFEITVDGVIPNPTDESDLRAIYRPYAGGGPCWSYEPGIDHLFDLHLTIDF